MPWQNGSLCYVIAVLLGISLLLNSLSGLSDFRNLSVLSGSVPVGWVAIVELTSSVLLFTTLASQRWDFLNFQNPTLKVSALLTFHVLNVAASFMVIELSTASLIELNLGSLVAYMNSTFISGYGDPRYEHETVAIDYMHLKYSCCGLHGKDSVEFWQQTKWFRTQTDYPLRRIPKSCCVNVDKDEVLQFCNSTNSSFCNWLKSERREELCSGNRVLPPGIHFNDVVMHNDCFQRLATSILFYVTRSLILGVADAVGFLLLIALNTRSETYSFMEPQTLYHL
ncbi:hypothetical protein L596_003765 [Steinernema carpocapsae]|uniref:Tetraspanin n=1 Tax=Steinernema carpocapsae TaxID=34508 RepID=A0A4U8UUP0_STECR|nr:hypothetical protein L596_003765 [Steinernema carpocapsae]